MNKVFEKFSLNGKKSLVTGASQGIGASISQVLAEAGSDLIIIGRDSNGLQKTRELIKNSGRECHVIASDLSFENEPEKIAKEALNIYPTIDVLINNAGTALLESTLSTTKEDWDRIQTVNLRAPFILAKSLVPRVIKQKKEK